MEFLLQKGYEVHSLIWRSSNFNTQCINHVYIGPHNTHKALMKLHYANLTDASSLRRWLDIFLPDKAAAVAIRRQQQVVAAVATSYLHRAHLLFIIF
ncbi:Rossmann-fold superfamily protein [Perilla frutescens var. frutescens]|nr:Rossmann-fold superfamily protein [Perilla frutescens var. frutescens]